MISINQAVINQTAFEKVAAFELEKDISTWNKEITDQFMSQVTYLPQGTETDIAISEIDENNGYAKGSVVAWLGKTRINFPIIVNNFKLAPFDVFVAKEEKDGQSVFLPANEQNVSRVLYQQGLGIVDNSKPTSMIEGIKQPGNIGPKQSVPLTTMNEQFEVLKMSSAMATKDDMMKLADCLNKNTGMPEMFYQNSGNHLHNTITQVLSNVSTPRTQTIGNLDLGGIVEAKQSVALVDSELFNADSMSPLLPGDVAELRMHSFPTMEDFLEMSSKDDGKLMIAKSGKPITGVIIAKCEMPEDRNFISSSSHPGEEKKKEKVPQIFLSSCGKYVAEFEDWDRTNVGFYGTKLGVNPSDIIANLQSKVLDASSTSNVLNKMDGSDKLLDAMTDANQGRERYRGDYPSLASTERTLLIFPTPTGYKATSFYDGFRTAIVNGAKVRYNQSMALIPSNVLDIVRVSKVSDPVLSAAVGSAKNIYLIPEASMMISEKFTKRLGTQDFVTPSQTVRKAYEVSELPKTEVSVSEKEAGFKLSGDVIAPIMKLAGVSPSDTLSRLHVKAILSVAGISKTASDIAMKTAFNRAVLGQNPTATIYGGRADYLTSKGLDKKASDTRRASVIEKIATALKRDLIKEASMLTDPDSVDVVLSLNFINKDNLQSYVEQIPTMEKVQSKLAGMLVASRMGLAEVPEGAIKNSISGLTDVLDGLKLVKSSLSKGI
jgi:hypothetical protein